uniref:Uncharacterized protein n=1 Tax=Manihot esculenta TaxID=3983 RepID=A0A2C9VAZ8_MANES
MCIRNSNSIFFLNEIEGFIFINKINNHLVYFIF